MLNLQGNFFYIAGVANKKSVATETAKFLMECGAKCIFSAQNEANLAQINKLFANSPAFLLNVEDEADIKNLKNKIEPYAKQLDGFLHSIAFANFSEGPVPFHQTKRSDFLQATQISSFSLVEMTNSLLPLFNQNASIVSIGISNLKATSYGYMGPIKAMLESTVDYLAKSLSQTTNIRVNLVKAGPLKTSASAGIPNYLENYLYAEKLTLRKKALETAEVAQTVAFLLSPLSSGINASSITIDAGMNANFFDQDVVKGFVSTL
jgi:enoyl-[acyl-carrier protein] reductase I